MGHLRTGLYVSRINDYRDLLARFFLCAPVEDQRPNHPHFMVNLLSLVLIAQLHSSMQMHAAIRTLLLTSCTSVCSQRMQG